MEFSKLQSSATGSKDIGAFYGVNRTNRINDYQLSDMKNFDCESFPYLATRRERKLFYNANKMAAICHDTDITDDYKVTGVTEDGDFVYRGNLIDCNGDLAGNTFMCECLGDYVFFPKCQSISSIETSALRLESDSPSSFGSPVPEPVVFKNDASYANAQKMSISVVGSRGVISAYDINHSTGTNWGQVLRSSINNDKFAVGQCFKFVIDWSNYGDDLSFRYGTVRFPEGVFLRVTYVNGGVDPVEVRFTAYDYSGNEFDYGAWLATRGDELSVAFMGNVRIEDSSVSFDLGSYKLTSKVHNRSSPTFGFLSIPLKMGAAYGNRMFVCDMFGIDVCYSSAIDKYDFAPGTSLGDAGAVSCTDPGRWTALKSFGGALYAFKKNGMYRIYSSDGLSFYMDKVADVGAVSQKAVCVVSDVMYFLSETGLYRFTGTYPEELPDNLGRHYTGGVLGGYDNKVYCSLSYSGGTELVVYDAQVNAYGIHDAFRASGFVTYGGKLYALNSADGYVYEMSGERKALEFSINTRRFFLSFEKKAINGLRLYFDFSGRENEKLEVFVSYDGGGWERCFKPIVSGRLKYVPIKFKKCDELCVKIQGTGVFTLKGMTLSLYSGGDIRQNR